MSGVAPVWAWVEMGPDGEDGGVATCDTVPGWAIVVELWVGSGDLSVDDDFYVAWIRHDDGFRQRIATGATWDPDEYEPEAEAAANAWLAKNQRPKPKPAKCPHCGK